MSLVTPPAPLVYPIRQAAFAVGVSIPTLEKAITEEKLIVRYSGAKRLIAATELLAWFESLPYERETA